MTTDITIINLITVSDCREGLEKHYMYYRKPYNGELGLESYEPWQLQHYAMVRTRPRGYKKIFLLINVKMPTIVGILTFMSGEK